MPDCALQAAAMPDHTCRSSLPTIAQYQVAHLNAGLRQQSAHTASAQPCSSTDWTWIDGAAAVCDK